MKLSILTWNTCCDPTMPDRLIRRREIHAALEEYAEKLDVIALQEMRSFKTGIFFYMIYRICKSLSRYMPRLFVTLDYLMMLEGFILPLITVDNLGETVAFLKNLGFRYSFSSPRPAYYMNSGLIISSRYPIADASSAYLARDTIHRPGMISVCIEVHGLRCQIVTCHLVPTLGGETIPYKICNMLNAAFNMDSRSLRTRSLASMGENLHPGSVVVAGDMNIARSDEDEYGHMMMSLELKNTSNDRFTTHDTGSSEKQIDYILVSREMAVHSFSVLDSVIVSDHFPLMAEVGIG
jgi:endonuclease/exonuclease/phosphatase family metal-dependent hydrolase